MSKILCKIGRHDWKITSWMRYQDMKHFRGLIEQGFDRRCEACNKKQQLKRPKKYDPVAYVWTDV